MDLITILGGGAIIAGLISSWGFVKEIFSQILAIFLISYTISEEVAEAVVNELRKTHYVLPEKIINLNTNRLFVKSYNRNALVLCQSLIDRRSNGDNKASSNVRIFINYHNIILVNNAYDIFTFTFIRGNINFEKFLLKIIKQYNEQFYINDKDKMRFYVRNIFGSLENKFNLNNQDSETEVKSSNETNLPRKISLGYVRIIGYDINEISLKTGYEQEYYTYLAYPQSVMEDIKDIEIWKDSKEWYRKRGIPWKRGWLLYGVPGCGKSALIRAIGEKFDLPIYTYHLITMSNQDLITEWNRMLNNTPCIALIEDIDSVFDGRTNLTKNTFSTALSFDTLLNVLDGIEKNDGLFSIITTNNIDKLDSALGVTTNNNLISSRPGRIDKAIKLTIMDKDCRKKIAQRILEDCPQFIDETVANGEGDTGAQFNERCVQIALHNYWKEDKNEDKTKSSF